ncbi:MAG: hypothetical protein R6W82_03470 [bacterium]
MATELLDQPGVRVRVDYETAGYFRRRRWKAPAWARLPLEEKIERDSRHEARCLLHSRFGRIRAMARSEEGNGDGR